ncbi:MAG TPA: enoyl-CoA hydratase-related protein [Burkholderiales bacterium]
MNDLILANRDGDIATVTLNNPDKLNALNQAMWRRLGKVMSELGAEESLRCIVLRGTGDKAFASGADISEFATVRASSSQANAYGEAIHVTMRAIADCRHPTLALIQGVCVGGGLEIASMCDLRICGASSRFGVPVNRLGLVMAYGEMQGLMMLVGRATALEIVLEGRVFGAEEAREKGLVNRVVPDDKVIEEAYATARRIADGAPLAARWHKRFINRLNDPRPLTEAERDESDACFDTEDFRIGYRAFLAKKKPEFKGK